MFVLGFHFPATMGNKVSDTAVLEKLEDSVKDSVSKVAAIKIYAGNDVYKTLTNASTILGKGLISYFEVENPTKEPKYFIFTNKYQLAALVRDNEKDAEALEVAAYLDKTREQITLEVSYK